MCHEDVFLVQEPEKKREKFLTAKYGAHQMAMIRKRLRVEMWMYDQLQNLYTGRGSSILYLNVCMIKPNKI